jgi:D-arabinonate dehydratase
VKVSSVEAFKVSVPLDRPARFATRIVSYRDYTVVKIETDEGGLVGYGLCWWNHPAEIVRRQLARHVLGKNPLEIEKLWLAMYKEVYRERKGGAICALSAIDIALWDIKSKYFRMPLHKLLGSLKEKVPCYASNGYYREGEGPSHLVDEIGDYKKMGFTSTKIKVGAVPLEEDIKRVKAVRDAFGYDLELMVDANNGYNRYGAIEAGREYEKFKVRWFEEPVWPDDLEGAAAACAALDVPIAQGELEYLRHGFQEIINHKAADILQPDAFFCGGITEFLKIAHMAEANNLPVAPHAEHDLHAQLAASVPNALIVEYFHKKTDVMKDSMLYESTLEPVDGFLTLPSEPGVGLRVDERKVREFIVKET